MEIAPHPPSGNAPTVAGTNTSADTQATPPSSERQTELNCAEASCSDIVPAISHRALLALDENAATGELPELAEHLRQIPFRLELRVPLSRFTLRDLQQLRAGALLLTEHLSVRDLVLTAAGERLLLVELEAVEQQLAARVKRLAWRHKWRRKA